MAGSTPRSPPAPVKAHFMWGRRMVLLPRRDVRVDISTTSVVSLRRNWDLHRVQSTRSAGDRAQRLFFDSGPLSLDGCSTKRSRHSIPAHLVPESARWGHQHRQRAASETGKRNDHIIEDRFQGAPGFFSPSPPAEPLPDLDAPRI
jgi:hypothetical protein